MIRLSSDITIGPANFNFVNDIEVVSSWENLTDTARIIMPNNIRPKSNGNVTYEITAGSQNIWKRGDKVVIKLGYDDNNANIFDGVITGISPKKPLEFLCEDRMYLLKQANISKYSSQKKHNSETITLKQLLTDILPSGTVFENDDITLGKFIFQNCSIGEAFDYLKRNNGLSIFFRNSVKTPGTRVLFAGLSNPLDTIDKISTGPFNEFTFTKNIIDDSDLMYLRNDDVKLKVVAVNFLPNGSKQTQTFGDDFGDMITLNFLNEPDWKKLATEGLQKYKYEGFRGSFLTFLQPTVRHGDAIRLVDPIVPDRNGVYLVRQVITRFGMDGGRQEIKLDRKISS